MFEKILESGRHLFRSDEMDVLLVDEQGQLQIAAYVGEAHDEVAATFPAPVERTPAGRAIRERKVVHWPDLAHGADVPGVLRKMAKVAGYQSMAFAPMLWEERGIGAVGVARSKGPFTDKELALLQTFADQAVIAIQNARLFNETTEALERQTASGEILASMSGSMTDTQPVFDAIARNLLRLFDTQFAIVALARDGKVELAGIQGVPGFEKLAASYPLPLDGFDPRRARRFSQARFRNSYRSSAIRQRHRGPSSSRVTLDSTPRSRRRWCAKARSSAPSSLRVGRRCRLTTSRLL